jgi:hypothetical protein
MKLKLKLKLKKTIQSTQKLVTVTRVLQNGVVLNDEVFVEHKEVSQARNNLNINDNFFDLVRYVRFQQLIACRKWQKKEGKEQ